MGTGDNGRVIWVKLVGVAVARLSREFSHQSCDDNTLCPGLPGCGGGGVCVMGDIDIRSGCTMIVSI